MKKNNEELDSKLSQIFTGLVIIAIILVANTILLVYGISSSNRGGVDTSTNEGTTSESLDGFKEIKASDLKKQTKGKNTIVYIGRETCSWCVKYIPILSKITKQYGVKPLYIDIAKIIDYSAGGSVTDQASFDLLKNIEAVSEFENFMEEDFGATPMTLIIKDGKLIAGTTGYMEEAGVVSFIEKYGFKK